MNHRVGVIGGGQLAWMMGLEAKALNIDLIVQTPKATDPAVGVAADTYLGAIANAEVTAAMAQHCDVITFENEFVDLDALARLAEQGVSFLPRLSSLTPLLDKYHQRQFFRQHDIPTPDFIALEADTEGHVDLALLDTFGFPAVLKARRHGYDGQGTHILDSKDAVETLLAQQPEVDWLLEAFVPFERELAVMAARFDDGTVVVYPVVETVQENQVCRRVLVMPDLAASVTQQAEAIAHTILTGLNVVGVFGIEFFLTQKGKVLVNEIAPRTHNSGHYTLDVCQTSQFEQQLRAVCQMAPGPIDRRCDAAVMVNLLGFETAESDYGDRRAALEQIPNAHLYWYGKTQSRPGRKLGHITVCLHAQPDESAADLRQRAEAIANHIDALWLSGS